MTADELKAKIDLEGDRKDFTYKEHECRVLRMPITGHLCGYVGVCTSSSLHGIDYGSLDSVEVHGGLTYSIMATTYPFGPSSGVKYTVI